MIDFKWIVELSSQIEALPNEREEPEISEIARRQNEALFLAKGILFGQTRQSHWKERFRLFCGIQKPLKGAALARVEVSDELLFDELLNACDESVLDYLLIEYGEDSKLGQRIQKMKAQPKLSEKSLRREIFYSYDEDQKSFYDLLKEEMEKRNYKSDADFYRAIHFSRKLFSKIRQRDYILSKDNVLWLTAGLGLDYWTTLKFLRAEGYSFRPRSRRDTIIVYVLKNGPYTLDDMNAMLYFFGEKALGESRSRENSET